MEQKTFITELNYEQVDINTKSELEPIYFQAKIHWGIQLLENQRYIDIRPFVDRVTIECGYELNSHKKIMIPNMFVDAVNSETGIMGAFNVTFLRDDEDPLYQSLITIIPKFISVDMDKKEMEVLFNA